MELLSYQNAAEMMRALAERLASELSSVLVQNGQATLAVPGGSTPEPLFDILSMINLDWANITIMLTDERWVPSDSSRSNTALVKNHLLVNAARAANYVALYEFGCNPKDGAEALSQRVAPYLPIDVLVLGMGADMHTASLFPGAVELASAQSAEAAAVVPIVPVGGDLEPRVTLSANALATAICTHVLILGAEKKAALARAQIYSPADAPISQFLPNATVHWCPS